MKNSFRNISDAILRAVVSLQNITVMKNAECHAIVTNSSTLIARPLKIKEFSLFNSESNLFKKSPDGRSTDHTIPRRDFQHRWGAGCYRWETYGYSLSALWQVATECRTA
ncbi:hypothetical protein AVEN_130407-1 [Araneus ventricosus]|uniref:Uncharacterized protein n=1 Tax=Araneus ventricosus TaxID=182803 RepID=A0A4Y2BEY7_ARAVE|nr:hypothetical protein AVEN_130407-1 [Araneus ventricosus]